MNTTAHPATVSHVFLEFVGWSVFLFFVLYIAWVIATMYGVLMEPIG